jgi:FHA domain
MDFGYRRAHARVGGTVPELSHDQAAAEVRVSSEDVYLSRWTTQGEQRRWTLPTTSTHVTIGRAGSVDVCIEDDPQVSRVHATMERIGDQWTIQDDGLSHNGTFVNGRRVGNRVRLRDRDVIRVGGTILTFCAPHESLSAATIADAGLPAVGRLTEPQRLVLEALCRPHRDGGFYSPPATNQHIAAELCLSLDAVKTHLRVLYHKFGIETLPQNQKRARLAELAEQLGLFSHLEDTGPRV